MVSVADRSLGVAIGARLASSVGEKLLAFIVLAYAGHRLGVELFGAYAYGVAINAFAILLADLGTLPVIIRRLARRYDPETIQAFRAALAGKTVLCGLAAMAAGTYAVLTTDAEGTRALAALAVALGTFQGAADTVTGAFVARGRQARVASAELLNRAAWAAVCVASLTLLDGDLALAGMGVGLLLGVVAQIASLWHVEFRNHGSASLWEAYGGLIREGRPLLAQALASTIYLRIDVMLLMPLLGSAVVGQYAAAVRLTEPPVLLAGLLASVLFPAFVRAAALDRGTGTTGHGLLAQVAEVMYWALTGVALIVVAASPTLLRVVFGPDFAGAAWAMRWLALAMLALAGNVLIQQALIAQARERTTLALSLVSGATSVIALVLLAPRFGVTGAGLASFIAYVTFPAVGLMLRSSRPAVLAALGGMRRPIVAAALAAVVLLAVRSSALGLMLGVAVYVLCFALLARPMQRLVKPLQRSWGSLVENAS